MSSGSAPTDERGEKKALICLLSFVSRGNTFLCISFVAKGPFWYYVVGNHGKLDGGRAQTQNSAAFVLKEPTEGRVRRIKNTQGTTALLLHSKDKRNAEALSRSAHK